MRQCLHDQCEHYPRSRRACYPCACVGDVALFLSLITYRFFYYLGDKACGYIICFCVLGMIFVALLTALIVWLEVPPDRVVNHTDQMLESAQFMLRGAHDLWVNRTV